MTKQATTGRVAVDIAHRFLLAGGHSDWCQVLLDVEHAARTLDFVVDPHDKVLGDIDAGLRACRIAHELLTYLDLDDDDADKAKARLVEMAGRWRTACTWAPGNGDDADVPDHPDGRDEPHHFYPATKRKPAGSGWKSASQTGHDGHLAAPGRPGSSR